MEHSRSDVRPGQVEPGASPPESAGARRWFLKSLAGAATLAPFSAAAAPKGGGKSLGSSGDRFDIRTDPIWFLVNRLSHGPSLKLYRNAKEMGYEAFLEQQLDFESISDNQVERRISNLFQTIPMTSKQIRDIYSDLTVPASELRQATFLRAFQSKRLLYQRMVEFWTDHFNIYQGDLNQILKTTDDRDVIRVHALGNFHDLLTASMQSPSMLVYLNNDLNTKEAPQENYARELMELHTLGVHGGYTNDDVKEVARCLTGWSMATGDANWGLFKFKVKTHDDTAKVFLGHQIPAGGGMQDGLMVRDIILDHPATAERISEKMCQWLLLYEPPRELVKRVAMVFRSTRGSIKDMIRTIMDPANIYNPRFSGVKIKRPFTFRVAMLRAMLADVVNPEPIMKEIDESGQAPFGWQLPTGYPDGEESWTGTMLSRWKFADDVLNDQINSTSVDVFKLYDRMGNPPKHRLAEGVNQFLAAGTMSPLEVAEIQKFLDSRPVLDETLLRLAFTLGASSPTNQLY